MKKKITNINFSTSYNTKLQCIKVDSTHRGDIYMAIIPGNILGMIFEQYKESLFDNNTNESYQLKRTGTIKKEILRTLRQEPDLFFLCNNGLSTIASDIETVKEEGVLYISRINNWQIINGATTTIAIAAAASLKKKKIDLNKVFVPLKICVIHNPEQEYSITSDIYNTTNRQVKPPFLDIIYSSDMETGQKNDSNFPYPNKELARIRQKLQKTDKIELYEQTFLRAGLDNELNLADDIRMAAEPLDDVRDDLCTYRPKVEVSQDPQKDEAYDDVCSSVFSPAEVKRKSNMLIQVYLHLPEETEKVLKLAQEAQKSAKRRDYIPLQCKLKNRDKVDVSLNIYGETLVHSEKKRIIWLGGFTKCTFSYYVPKDIEDEELRCVAILSVNGAQIGEMCFVTQIVETPRSLHPEVFTRKFSKIFISYAHQDESKVKFIAQAYKAQGVDYFFDRDYLKAGDIFPQKIKDYINSADLFILCWSENAAKSDYVKKERSQALDRAYPKVKPIENAPLSIYPLSIEPRADYPEDMKSIYNFEQI